MNSEEAATVVDSMEQGLADKGELHLTVRIETREQARQLLRWMHGSVESRPMLMELLNIAWDQELVSKEVAEAVRTIRGSAQ